jgi:hypothetical protein
MAISYYLDMATDIAPAELIDLVSGALSLAKRSPTELDVPGVLVRADASSRLGREMIEEAFHFVPSVNIGFRMLKDIELRHGANLSMLRICNVLLERTQADMVFLCDNERPELLRVGGRLAICNADGFWRPSFLDCISLPYTMAELPRL